MNYLLGHDTYVMRILQMGSCGRSHRRCMEMSSKVIPCLDEPVECPARAGQWVGKEIRPGCQCVQDSHGRLDRVVGRHTSLDLANRKSQIANLICMRDGRSRQLGGASSSREQPLGDGGDLSIVTRLSASPGIPLHSMPVGSASIRGRYWQRLPRQP